MQKTSLIGLVLMVVLFSSCGYYERKENIALYNQIKSTNDSLDKMTREWHHMLDKAVIDRNFDSLHPLRLKMGEFLNRKRGVIANLEVPASAENLKGSEQVFLSAQANAVAEIYPAFEQFNELTPDATVKNQLKVLAGDLETETAWVITLKKSLEAFATKNNIHRDK
jgi:hypothetical protein